MKKSEVYQLFVYGSLRSGFKSPAYEYISRYFTLVGNAKVKAELFDMGTYPAAVPTNENKFVLGELYRIKQENEFSWAMGQLDDYEGVTVDFDEVKLYRKELVEVFINDQITHAWIYWYNGDISGKPPVASGDILEYLKQKK
jgi:gamma-glutamylcyclotransferase (GGCT)/AIG2-like uncharacterized protein YtfP